MNTYNWKYGVACFLTAQTISLFGSSLVQYAIVWHITLTTSSGSMLCLSTLCGFLPQIFISFFSGVWADRYDRKTLIMLSDGLIAFSTMLLAIACFMGKEQMGFLFAVLAIRSAGAGVQMPAVQALLPQMTPGDHLMRVNGIHATLSAMMTFLSPAISGVLLSVASLQVVLCIDVVTAVIGILMTAPIPVPPYDNERTSQTKASCFSQQKQGFTYLKQNAFIRRLLLFQLMVLFLISPSAFLTPLMVSRTFGPQVWRLTASEMTYSLGMVLGGFIITAWGGFQTRMHTVIMAGVFYGLCMLGLAASPIFILYLICNTWIGMTTPCYQASLNVIIQESVEPRMHGRIFSLMQIATSCALPLGMALFGPLADLVSVQKLLAGGGTAVLLLCLIFFLGECTRSQIACVTGESKKPQ